MDPETTAHLDKDALYVTYCDGIGCNASTKGALNMVRLGFNVKELMGGLDWWIRDGYETEGLQATEGRALGLRLLTILRLPCLRRDQGQVPFSVEIGQAPALEEAMRS